MIPQPYSQEETLQIIIAETKNQLTRCEVMGRMYDVLNAKSNLNPKVPSFDMATKQNNKSIEQFKMTLSALEAVKDRMDKERHSVPLVEAKPLSKARIVV